MMEFEEYKSYVGSALNCNFCGSTQLTEWGRRGIFYADRCDDCGLVFINPRLTEEGLSKYYSDYFQKREEDTELTKKRHIMYRLDADFILKYMYSHKIILDIGCGGGYFLSYFPDKYTKLGTELDPVAASHAIKKYGIKCYTGDITKIQIDEPKVDVIMLRGVLEHMIDPKRALLKMSKLLANEGLLYITATPNLNSICAQLYRGIWNLFDPCVHLYYFNEPLLTNLLTKNGFSLIDQHYFYKETPYANLREDYECIVEDLQKLIKGLKIERNSPPFWGNMMTLVYQKNKAVMLRD